MTKKAIIITVPVLVSLLLVYLFLPSDTKRIRKIIYDGRDAIVRKDLERVMAHVSYNYRDRYGFTYLSIKENLKSLFRGPNPLRLKWITSGWRLMIKRQRPDSS